MVSKSSTFTNILVSLAALSGLVLGAVLDRNRVDPTLVIVSITVILSVIGFSNTNWLTRFYFTRGSILSGKQYYRLLTYGFIHLDFSHLLFNMLSLYSFSPLLYRTLSAHLTHPALLLIFIYILAIIISTIPDLLGRGSDEYRALGASGAVLAVIAAAVVFNPNVSLNVLFIPLPIPGPLFLFLFIAVSLYLAHRGKGRVGHVVHISGAIFGLIVAFAIKFLANF